MSQPDRMMPTKIPTTRNPPTGPREYAPSTVINVSTQVRKTSKGSR